MSTIKNILPCFYNIKIAMLAGLLALLTLATRFLHAQPPPPLSLFSQHFDAKVNGLLCGDLTTIQPNSMGCFHSSIPIYNWNKFFCHEFCVFVGADDNAGEGITFFFSPTYHIPASTRDGKFMGCPDAMDLLNIAIDTRQNSGTNDLAADHLEVGFRGNVDSCMAQIQADSAQADIEDGQWHMVSISWYPQNQELRVFWDQQPTDNPRITLHYDFVNNLFGGNPFTYLGISGANGISPTTLHQVCVGGNCSALLPIELSYFDGREDSEEVQLDWIARDMVNFSHFEIFRQHRDSSFSLIGSVDGPKQHDEEMTFSFTDTTAAEGVNIYQLKMVDLNGTFGYSDMVIIEVSPPEGQEILWSIYPNPVDQKSREISINLKRESKYQIHNQMGQTIQIGLLSSGRNRLPLPDLPRGVYIIMLEEKFSQAKRLIIQ